MKTNKIEHLLPELEFLSSRFLAAENDPALEEEGWALLSPVSRIMVRVADAMDVPLADPAVIGIGEMYFGLSAKQVIEAVPGMAKKKPEHIIDKPAPVCLSLIH
jgi:hypothetical protein